MPVIVMKVDTRGTLVVSDDRLLPGAVFDLHRDDGDGIFEPRGADAQIVGVAVTRRAFLVFRPALQRPYWVTETHPPRGYGRARPVFVPDLASLRGRNCVVIGGPPHCFADDDRTVGFVLVVIRDTKLRLIITQRPTPIPSQTQPVRASGEPAIADDPALRRRARRGTWTGQRRTNAT